MSEVAKVSNSPSKTHKSEIWQIDGKKKTQTQHNASTISLSHQYLISINIHLIFRKNN